VVKRGKCPETGEEVAIKIVDRIRYGAQHSQNLEREIALLQRVSSAAVQALSVAEKWRSETNVQARLVLHMWACHTYCAMG
jgi:hypothetical protein